MTVAQLEVLVDAKIDNLRRNLAEAERAAGKSGRKMQDEAGRVSQAWARAGDGLTRFGQKMSLGVTLPLSLLGKQVFNAAVSWDSLKRSLVTVTGSAEEAAKELERLREVAKMPGLGFREAIEGAVRLRAAGMEADEARNALQAFGNALATVGKGKADLDGVILALTQIAAKGKVTAQEINQIAERVPQIRKIMESALGTADTEKLQKAGISAKDFIAVITYEAGKLPKVTKGIQNDLENAADSIDQSMIKIGESMIPLAQSLLSVIVPAVERAATAFSAMDPGVQKLIVSGIALGVAVGPLSMMFGGLAKAVAWLTALGPAAVASQTAQAGAMTATGNAAFGAQAKILALKAATLGLLALAAVPIIITVKTVYDYSDAVKGQKEAVEGYANRAMTPGDMAEMIRKKEGISAAAAVNKVRASAWFKRYRAEQEKSDPNTIAMRKRETEKDRMEALMAKLRQQVAQGGAAKPKGGGGGTSAAEKLQDEYGRTLADLTRQSVLGADATEKQRLAYELLHGELRKLNPAQKERLMGLASEIEANEKSKAAHDQYASTLKGIYKETQLGRATTELERLEIERKAAGLPALTKAERERVAAAIAVRDAEDASRKATAEATEEIKRRTEANRELIASMLEKASTTGREVSNLESGLKSFFGNGGGTFEEFTGVISAAGAADEAARREKSTAALKKYREEWANVIAKVREYHAEEAKDQKKRIADAYGHLAQRVALTGKNAKAAAVYFELLGKGIKNPWEILKLMQKTLEVEKLEEYAKKIQDIASMIGDHFMGMLDKVFQGGFRNFFQNVVGGFRQMLQDIAIEMVKSKIRELLANFLISALPKIFGGGPAPAGKAVGGPVQTGGAYLVGERGPELFVPSGSGQILTSRQTRAALAGGGGVTVVVNVSTPDVQGFRASKDQVAAEAGAAISRAMRRNGVR